MHAARWIPPRMIQAWCRATVLALALCVGVAPLPARALSTAFTYQGQLQQSGMPENGTCDFQFIVYDQAGSGSPPTGGTLQGCVVQHGVSVTNGLFTVPLDFGSSPPTPSPFTGSDRWLQIAVCCGQGCPSATCPTVAGSYTTLSPRQQLTAAPYALYATSAGSASGLSSSCSGCVSGSNIAAGTITGSNLAPSTITGTNIATSTITGSNLASGVAATNLGFTPAHAGANADITSLSGITGNISLPESTATAGNILKGSTRFIHDYPGAGSGNTFVGESAGNFSLSGTNNTAVGNTALQSNTNGGSNTALGNTALASNTGGNFNTALGQATLFFNTGGSDNTAIGDGALNKTTGNANTAVGRQAGINLTGGSNNIDIGNGVGGVAGESNTIRIGNGTTATYIAGIAGSPVGGSVVAVASNGQLGTAPASVLGLCVPNPAATPRFVDNGDSTVTDRQTCLMWEKKDSTNVNNTYTWSASGTAADGTAFTDFLPRENGTLCDNSSCTGLGGHGDWRLPRIGELQTIVDGSGADCQDNPCIDPIFGPTQAQFGGYYWTSSVDAGNPRSVWLVPFGWGVVSGGDKGGGFYVRAVRGGS